MHVRAPPGSGKTVLKHFLYRYILQVNEDVNVIALNGWRPRPDEKWSQCFKRTVGRAPDSLFASQAVSTYILWDEGQEAYDCCDLWTEFLKSIKPASGPYLIMFTSYGDAGLRQSSFVEGNERPEETEWPAHRRFQGKIEVEPREEALRKAKEWKDTKNSIWTDGSRLEGGKVGAAAVWWAPERVEPPWVGPATGRTYNPGRREAGWTGRRYHLGKNKEVYDAELYALYQAAKLFDERNERDQAYTILSDSEAAIGRAKDDDMGPGQRFAVAVIEVCSRLASRGNTLTLRWVPSHLGVEGNEQVHQRAGEVAAIPRRGLRHRDIA